MTIAPCGTFDYCGKVGSDFENTGTTVLLQSPLRHESLSSDATAYRRLVGFSPVMEFADENAVIRATERDNSVCSSVAFGLPNEIAKTITANDKIYVSRNSCADLGFALVRDDSLLFALGAIRSVPLADVVASHSSLTREWQSNQVPTKNDDHFIEFVFAADKKWRVHDGEFLKANGFSIFVRNTFLCGMPGESECVFILRDGLANHLDYELTIQNFLKNTRPVDWPDVELERKSAIRKLECEREDRNKLARETLQEYLKNQPDPDPNHPFFNDD